VGDLAALDAVLAKIEPLIARQRKAESTPQYQAVVSEMRGMRNELAEKVRELDELRKQLADRGEALDELRTQLAEYEVELSQLRAATDGYMREVNEVRSTARSLWAAMPPEGRLALFDSANSWLPAWIVARDE
jgi:uncharacterized coiled-coil DUF342 family protein